MSESDLNSISPLKRALLAVEDMKARLEAAERRQAEPVAIIGMGCTFPGDSDRPEKFWELLRDGRDAVTEIPRERFDIDAYYNPEPGTPGKTHTRFGAFVKDIDKFDPAFAGVAPKNAFSIDPQQRLFAKTCWAAIENAGLATKSLEGSATGVYVGIWSVEYWHRLASRPAEQFDGNLVGGNLHSLCAGGVSYLLGLKGPSLSLDTACSSALVAVDLAVQGLRSGSCDMALAGGVNVILGPDNYICMSGMSVLSPDGRCKSFDASANGFGRGEGAGAVLLKRLSDAVRDGDRIQAVIYGTSVTQDGKTSGIAVPHGPSQEAAARRALNQAGLAPAQVSYVEAHGTGTPIGDPIEIQALARVYGEGRSKADPLLVGSAKSNIAHLESAAGIAGLIKVILALQHEALPKNLHFENPNPEIPWDALPVQVVSELTEWPRSERPRYAAVSSFGVSGTNAHLVIGEAPVAARPERLHPERPVHLLVASAKDADSVHRYAKMYSEHLDAHPELDAGDACFTANTGRSAFKHRVAVVGRSLAELRDKLSAVAAHQQVKGTTTGRARTGGPRVAFLFTGQGAQYVQMGRDLYERQPAFREALERCDAILRDHMDRSLLEVLYPANDASPLDDTTYTQPALFAMEYALAAMWRSWGVEPDFVLGHSVGEYAAACVAGVFELEDGLRLIAERGRLMGALPREGSMVAVLADEARVSRAVEPHVADVSIAALNGPENVVISGRREAVDAIVAALEADGVETRRLNVSHAFHSPLMEPIGERFERAARAVDFREPLIPIISNLTGARASQEVAIPEYWVSHIRKPVRFSDGMAALAAEGCDLFVEIGPRPVLSGMGADCVAPGASTFLPSLRPDQDAWERVLLTLGELFVRGVDVDWERFDAGYGRMRVALPTYPFNGQRYFVDADKNGHGGRTDWLTALLEDEEKGRLVEEIKQSGRFSEGEARLLGRLLQAFSEEYQRRANGHASASDAVVADYYDTFRNVTPDIESMALEEVTEAYLTFAPMPEVVPGYSWVLGMIDPKNYPEMAQTTLEAHRYLREALFRKVDFSKVERVLDFGCGYGSDLCTLALKHEHIQGTGYTLSPEQRKVGQKKAERLGLGNRIEIYNRDSSKDEFPHTYQLAFGFEVAHHVPNKRALFGHLSRHLEEGGKLVLADFISRTGFSIDYDTISSYFPTTQEWTELLSENQLLCVDLVDISREMSYFFHDPDFDRNVEKLVRAGGDAEALRGLKSYDRLGHLHAQGLALYVLMTSEKRTDLTVEELKRRNEQVLAEPVPYSETSTAHGCYEVEWLEKHRPVVQPAGGERGQWLLLSDRGGVGEALAKRLETSGQEVVRVSWGESFSRNGDGTFTVAPREREDMERLLAESASASGVPLVGVVHMWSLDAPLTDDLDLATLREVQQRGCGSLIALVQALGRVGGATSPKIWIVTEQAQPLGDGPIRVAQAPLLGVGRGIPLEHPELWGGMVDLESGDVDRKVEAVLAEIDGPDGEYMVAYREGTRRVGRLARRRRPDLVKPAIHAEGTYLITGGTGGLGLEAARWLAAEGARHLVLTSRRGAVEPNDRIRELERQGVEVRVVKADVRSEEDMRSVMAGSGSPSAPLRGIIHAAGVAGGSVMAQETWEHFNEVLDTKLAGTWIVHQLARELPLDFFVCFSSVAQVLGSAGQAAYSAANSFEDALCHHRVRAGMPALVVNWGLWGEVGLVTRLPEANRKALNDRGMGEIDPRDATRVLGALLVEGSTQTVVMQVNWVKFFQKAIQGVEPPFFERVAPRTERAALAEEAKGIRERLAAAPHGDRRELIAEYTLERVGKILGHPNPETIDGESTLLELGFDSLMAVQLRNAIRSNLEVDVPIGRLFDTTSIDKLVEMLQEQVVDGLVLTRGDGESAPEVGQKVEVI